MIRVRFIYRSSIEIIANINPIPVIMSLWLIVSWIGKSKKMRYSHMIEDKMDIITESIAIELWLLELSSDDIKSRIIKYSTFTKFLMEFFINRTSREN